jgi:predicted TIM-barrel fold metal-dependent hydrolase
MTDIRSSVTGIDSHAHVFTQDLPLVSGRRYAPAYDAPLERYRAMLAGIGMSHGVLIQPSFLGFDNSYLLDCLDAYPQQLRGVVMTDPVDAPGCIDDWHARGVVGVRANLIGVPLPDFSGQHWTALLSRMAALDWHLEMQIDAGRLFEVVPVLLASGVRIVIDHFGRFDPALGTRDPGFRYLLALGLTRRVWVKVSAGYRVSAKPSDYEATFATSANAWAELLSAFGGDRLLWGTDWPHTQFEHVWEPQRALDDFYRLVPDASHRQTVLIDTPTELFHFR